MLAILNCQCELNFVNVKALTFDLTLAIFNFICPGKCIAEQILLVAKTSESCYIYFSCIKWFSSAFWNRVVDQSLNIRCQVMRGIHRKELKFIVMLKKKSSSLIFAYK